MNPTAPEMEVVGGYLTAPEADPWTGVPFTEPADATLVLGPGEKKVLVVGISLARDEPAHADGIAFSYLTDGQVRQGQTNLRIQVETTPTGCQEYGESLSGGGAG